MSAKSVEHSDTERQNTAPASLGAPAALLPFFNDARLTLELGPGGDAEPSLVVEPGCADVGNIEADDILAERRLYS
jgi:hypothetical protein